jgi:prepilin-type processing-associated H-X9-DG protein
VGTPHIQSTFQDGTSNTILFAEKYGVCNHPAGGGSTWSRQSPNPSTYGAYFNYIGSHGIGGPSAPAPPFQLQPPPTLCDYRYASTGHTGGINVGLVDGSVRNVAQGISAYAWWAACTPAGGEPPQPGW